MFICKECKRTMPDEFKVGVLCLHCNACKRLKEKMKNKKVKRILKKRGRE